MPDKPRSHHKSARVDDPTDEPTDEPVGLTQAPSPAVPGEHVEVTDDGPQSVGVTGDDETGDDEADDDA